MKVTGSQLRNALSAAKSRVKLADVEMAESTFAFDGETKAPLEKETALADAEDRLARLESAQQAFNQATLVVIEGQNYPLAYAIKRVGVEGRMAKLFRELIAPKKERYSYHDPKVRDTDKVFAKMTITRDQALERHLHHERLAMECRNAISNGNQQEFETELITPEDLGVV